MKSMPRTTAFNIYKSEYVIKPAFDQIAVISLSVAGEMIDTGINMGVSVAGTFLQQSLNALNEAGLKEDGACGKQTRVALAAYINKRGPDAEVILLRALNVYQGAKYLGLTQTHPEDHRFINGWLLNRVVI